MSKEQIFRISGLTAILVGLVLVVFNAAAVVVQLPQQLINYRTFLTPFLLIYAFTGLYAYQAQKAGLLGFAGYVLTIASLVLNACFRFADTFIGSILLGTYTEAIMAILQGPYSTVQSITFALFLIGYVLFGIGTLRARMLPRWAAWMLILGAVMSFALVMLPVNFGAILAGIALAWMGYAQYGAVSSEEPAFAGQSVTQQ